MCVELFDILCSKYFDYVDFKRLLRKGAENLSLGEELRVVNFDFEDFKSAYDYFCEVKMIKCDSDGKYFCSCQQKYLIPKWMDIVV